MTEHEWTDEKLAREFVKEFYSPDLSLREVAEPHEGITYQDVRRFRRWDELERAWLTKKKRRAVKRALGLPVTEPGGSPADLDVIDGGKES